VKSPVDSRTTSTPISFQGSSSGFLTARIFTSFPLTTMASDFASTVPSKCPKQLSYFKRCAKVAGFVISLMATISKSAFLASAALNAFLPILPNPLIPTFVFIIIPPLIIY
jgi:hypothetical protein